MTAPTRSDVVRWLAGFETAAAADREALRAGTPDSARSVQLALSLIATMWQVGGGRPTVDPIREREVERVRDTWLRLAAGWRR
jgi:hypothetical protein